MGFFNKIKQGLQKTRDSLSNSVNSIINSFTRIDEDLFEELEEILVMADIGVNTATEICDILRKKIKEQGIKDPQEIKKLLKNQQLIEEKLGVYQKVTEEASQVEEIAEKPKLKETKTRKTNKK